MNRLFILFCLFFIAVGSRSFAQDTLPDFSVKNVGNNRYIIGWVNHFTGTNQISIQRSHDSLRNYTTILTVTDPRAVQNGYADAKAPNDHMFYRLFISLDNGQYFFTKAKRPELDTARTVVNSVIQRIRDTMTMKNGIRKEVFIPSYYVYTNKEGYVFINLPDADKKKYRIRFLEEDGSFLFEIKSIREPALTLDKVNFLHAGWFRFELYNDEQLVEKNKFYLAKDF